MSVPLRVCAWESRRGEDMRSLIQRQGGLPTIAPSMREIPLEENPVALEFAGKLLAGQIDVMLFLTGVGARGLLDVLETRHTREAVFAAWDKTTNLVRGPKPAAVLREWKVRIDHQVREPNTWREVLEAIDQSWPVRGKQVAVQEYGKPSPELYAGLTERGAEIHAVPVYRWTLPIDIAPLQAAIRQTIAGDFDVLLWTSAFQLNNVLSVAESLGLHDEWLAAALRCVIGSIGPTATENLTQFGLVPDLEPSHPKMGHLVKETLAAAPEILARKSQSR